MSVPKSSSLLQLHCINEEKKLMTIVVHLVTSLEIAKLKFILWLCWIQVIWSCWQGIWKVVWWKVVWGGTKGKNASNI
jgi:hypothetical protein